METLDSLILLSRSLKKCIAAFVALLSSQRHTFQFVPFLACKRYSYLPRGDRVTGFKSPDKGRFTALFTSSVSFPDREETRTWSANNNFFSCS